MSKLTTTQIVDLIRKGDPVNHDLMQTIATRLEAYVSTVGAYQQSNKRKQEVIRISRPVVAQVECNCTERSTCMRCLVLKEIDTELYVESEESGE